MKKSIPLLFAAFIILLLTGQRLAAQTGQLEGTILSKKGNIIELQLISKTGDDFQNGTEADMSKYFEEKMGNMNMNGWLGVAKVKFIPTTRQNITIEILKQTSDITVNGEKVNHFKVGKRMKLEWPAKAEAMPEKTTE